MGRFCSDCEHVSALGHKRFAWRSVWCARSREGTVRAWRRTAHTPQFAAEVWGVLGEEAVGNLTIFSTPSTHSAM
jgi:hypothetical protein